MLTLLPPIYFFEIKLNQLFIQTCQLKPCNNVNECGYNSGSREKEDDKTRSTENANEWTSNTMSAASQI